jgi:hypothetical protein
MYVNHHQQSITTLTSFLSGMLHFTQNCRNLLSRDPNAFSAYEIIHRYLFRRCQQLAREYLEQQKSVSRFSSLGPMSLLLQNMVLSLELVGQRWFVLAPLFASVYMYEALCRVLDLTLM